MNQQVSSDQSFTTVRGRSNSLLLLAAFAAVWAVWTSPQRWEFDSFIVYQGTRELLRLLGGAARSTLLPIGPFAPFQFFVGLPVVALMHAGVPVEIYGVWSTISSISLFGLAWVAFRACRSAGTTSATAWIATLLIVCGPFTAYGATTFNEPVAALLVSLFVLAVTGKSRLWICGLLFILSGLTKEVAPPLLLIFWTAGLWMRHARGQFPVNRKALSAAVVVMAISAVLTFAAIFAFNELRYGTYWNREYWSDLLLVHRIDWRVEYAAALWLSPSGGVLFFWPTLVAALAGIVIASQRELRSPSRLMPVIAALGVIAAVTIGLSGWFCPFGWWCWGPRLMLPWLAGALVLCLRAEGKAFERVVRWMLVSQARFLLSVILFIAAAIPHILILRDSDTVNDFFVHVAAEHPLKDLTDRQMQHASISDSAWRGWPPLIVRPITRIKSYGESIPPCIAIAVAIAIVMHNARRQVQITDQTSAALPPAPGRAAPPNHSDRVATSA